MEEKAASWCVGVTVAAYAAVIIYNCAVNFVDGETIRQTAETGIVFVAIGFTASFLKG
jgi:hypothetical protein